MIAAILASFAHTTEHGSAHGFLKYTIMTAWHHHSRGIYPHFQFDSDLPTFQRP